MDERKLKKQELKLKTAKSTFTRCKEGVPQLIRVGKDILQCSELVESVESILIRGENKIKEAEDILKSKTEIDPAESITIINDASKIASLAEIQVEKLRDAEQSIHIRWLDLSLQAVSTLSSDSVISLQPHRFAHVVDFESMSKKYIHLRAKLATLLNLEPMCMEERDSTGIPTTVKKVEAKGLWKFHNGARESSKEASELLKSVQAAHATIYKEKDRQSEEKNLTLMRAEEVAIRRVKVLQDRQEAKIREKREFLESCTKAWERGQELKRKDQQTIWEEEQKLLASMSHEQSDERAAERQKLIDDDSIDCWEACRKGCSVNKLLDLLEDERLRCLHQESAVFDIDEPCPRTGQYLILNAAWNGHLELVHTLLQRGCNVHSNDAGGLTALHLASRGGFVSIVRLLLENGARADTQSRNGDTPLHWAIRRKHTEIVRALLEECRMAHHKCSSPSMYGRSMFNPDLGMTPCWKQIDLKNNRGRVPFDLKPNRLMLRMLDEIMEPLTQRRQYQSLLDKESKRIAYKEEIMQYKSSAPPPTAFGRTNFPSKIDESAIGEDSD
eukprot:TRINITY_DN103032_c0_g1_i1.p1 TRINITY_DN103032_c0_g1~~TRINITY_DN103032_c0_g1_i1.p1  ORF type:complete len:558 (-),score=167.50 TRINITY_DN103032_c0_g1_i1:160-1833(-)